MSLVPITDPEWVSPKSTSIVFKVELADEVKWGHSTLCVCFKQKWIPTPISSGADHKGKKLVVVDWYLVHPSIAALVAFRPTIRRNKRRSFATEQSAPVWSHSQEWFIRINIRMELLWGSSSTTSRPLFVLFLFCCSQKTNEEFGFHFGYLRY